MKLLGLFLLVNFLCVARGFQYRDVKDQGSGKCICSEYGFELKAADELNPVPGQCLKATCSEDSVLDVMGCGAVDISEPGCKLTDVVANATYPACCPTMECSKE